MVGGDKLVYGLGPLYVVTTSGTTTFARDGGKSIRAELGGSGGVGASFRYRAYGEIAQSSGGAAPAYLGYAGQLFDPSGFYYMRARWYDPATARFLSRDPLGGVTGNSSIANLYGYALGNPLAYSDPSGLLPVDQEGKPVPFWRQREMNLGKELATEYAGEDVTILHNRAVRDPETGRTLRDANGRLGRPDWQVIDNTTRNVLEVAEQGTGSQINLMRKLEQVDRYREITAQLESRPTMRLEYEVTPSPLFRIGGKLLLPLMILDLLTQSVEFIESEQPRIVKS